MDQVTILSYKVKVKRLIDSDLKPTNLTISMYKVNLKHMTVTTY